MRAIDILTLIPALLLFGACSRSATSETPPARQELPVAEVIDPTAVATGLVAVADGVYRPLYGKDVDRVAVPPFRLESHPVTNAQFAAFVRANPQWQRSQVKTLFADEGYLSHWAADTDCGPDNMSRPVTRVSWFAARAYANWVGRRLPTTAEWEVAANDFDIEETPLTNRILAWYSRPNADQVGEIGSGLRNQSGIADLHGLVWEWVDDFNSALVTGESRGDPGLERTLFCGSGAVGATDPTDYAAFMRYAFRSSLRAGYTVKNLGFRCATGAASDGETTPSCCSGEVEEGEIPLPGVSVYQLGSEWIDHDGQPRKLAEFRGKPTLVAMIYTNCRYACPRLAADARRILAALSTSERRQVRGLFVSMDPERDTPERLREFAGEHGLDLANWTLLRGDAGAVRELAAVLGISYLQAPSGDFSHSNAVNLLDTDGVITHRQQGLEVEPTGTVEAIRKLLK